MVNASGSGNQSLEYQGITSGHPPESITDLGVLPILERPASPLASEEQQLAKKSKGDGTKVDFGGDLSDVTNMETDATHSERPGEPQSDNSNLRGKETYASMAAKGRSGNGIPVLGNDTDSDEVVVLDEDCTVDESEYEGLHRICYSCGIYGHDAESCGHSSSTKEDPRLDMSAPALKSTVEGSNTSLYGPWMIATTRRRGAAKVTIPVNSTIADHNHARGSRFAALHVEEVVDAAAGRSELDAGISLPISEEALQGQHRRGASSVAAVPRQEITKNAAYLVSNPARKSRKGAVSKDVVGELNVVPASSEHATSVVPHTVQRGTSSHNAILIVEPGYEANTGSHSRTAKSTGNRTPTLWAKEFADQIDVLTANEQYPPDTSVNRDRLENDMDYSSVDGDDFVDSSLEKSKDGTGVPSQGF
ncbi:hypothetical protein V6N13_057264 [Hibiscus sabdariffa]|uniref:CCHC-type domain-containing protein n=1 Tax=Hibiscus sabdariffa TaxID=183260 RepID=A0ABR2ACP1_9ROSI